MNLSAYHLVSGGGLLWIGGPPPSLGDMRIPTPPEVPHVRLEALEQVVATTLRCGLRITAQRRSVIVIDFSNGPEAARDPATSELPDDFDRRVSSRAVRARIANVHILCIASALLELKNLGMQFRRATPHQLVHYNDDGSGGSGLGLLEIEPQLGGGTYWLRMQEIPIEVIERGNAMLDTVLVHADPGAFTLCAILGNAVAAYQDHEYESSLVSSWTVCEAILNRMWIEYVATAPSIVTSERRRRLLGPDFTASIVSEALSLAGILSDDLFSGVGAARRARNRWLHSQQSVDSDAAAAALRTSAELMEQVLSIKFYISLGRTIH